jgi:serine phosphatase RsbU (regulator of sigma subunit)/pSer/pThr/pTyr-binding forkhead associated (FHA) protein
MGVPDLPDPSPLPPQVSPMAVISFVKGFNQGSKMKVDGERIVVGRNADCGVVLNEPAVSREHAVIRKIQGKFYIEDLKSRNGTFVNGKEVKARTLLKDKDKVKICDNLLAFYEHEVTEDDDDDQGDQEPDTGDSSTIEATLAAPQKQVLSTHPSEKLTMLIELGQELSQTFNVEQLLPKIAESLFNVFKQADRVFIIFADEGKLIPKVIKTRRNTEDSRETRFSRKIVNMCLETGQAILWEDAASGKMVELTASIADVKIRSVMCVPLASRDANQKALGVIQLDRFKKFSQDDLKLLLSVAGQSAVALDNARMHESLLLRIGLERDLQTARQVQHSFLPKSMPKLDGYLFAAHYESAQEIGGDYYDFIPLLGNRRIGVMIGDVAGKGVPAALLMAKVSAEVRYVTLTEETLAKAITRLNELLQEAGLIDRFVTLGACLIDPATHEVSFVNAGHVPPLVYRKATDTFEAPVTTEMTGYPLAVVDGYPYEMTTFRLDPGDSVLLITDGVTESKNQEEIEFQMTGVEKALRAGPMEPDKMLERVVGAVRKHATGRKPHDDITIVCFGRIA